MKTVFTKSFTRKIMAGHRTMPPIPEEYGTMEGLEGPFRMLNGRIVYYDPSVGKYIDRKTDIYLSDEEAHDLHFPKGVMARAAYLDSLKKKSFRMFDISDQKGL